MTDFKDGLQQAIRCLLRRPSLALRVIVLLVRQSVNEVAREVENTSIQLELSLVPLQAGGCWRCGVYRR